MQQRLQQNSGSKCNSLLYRRYYKFKRVDTKGPILTIYGALSKARGTNSKEVCMSKSTLLFIQRIIWVQS